jgi:hypothetical protein
MRFVIEIDSRQKCKASRPGAVWHPLAQEPVPDIGI